MVFVVIFEVSDGGVLDFIWVGEFRDENYGVIVVGDFDGECGGFCGECCCGGEGECG